jgi:hypothetical protein
VEQPSTPDNLTTALLAAAVNFGSLEKDSDNPYFKSKYLSLGALLNAVRPALSDQGVLIVSRYLLIPQGWVVETTLIHGPSGTMQSSQFPVVDCSNSQKIGASGTFAMRYNLLQLLGVAASDDDGNSAAGLAAPDDFLGPPPSGQQRAEPRRLPDPNAHYNWSTPRLPDPNAQPGPDGL